jgi:hypothetical protein
VLLRCGGYQGEASVHTGPSAYSRRKIRRAGAEVEVRIHPNITGEGRRAADLAVTLAVILFPELAHLIPRLAGY